MKKLRDCLRQRLIEVNFAVIAGIVSLVLGIFFTIHGGTFWPGFLENIGPELVGIGITVLFIDIANQCRDKQAEIRLDKKRLIREMNSTDNATALRAVQELKDNGWLYDESLVGKRLHYMRTVSIESFREREPSGANLRRADLSGADLRGTEFFDADLRNANLWMAKLQGVNLNGACLDWADLSFANLENTNLNSARMDHAVLLNTNLRGAKMWGVDLQGMIGLQPEVQLVLANMLRLATMPDGSRYDGRYNLSGDFEYAEVSESRDITDPNKMADYYKVPIEEYLAGQEWARVHLQELRSHAEAWYNQHWSADFFQGSLGPNTDLPR